MVYQLDWSAPPYVGHGTSSTCMYGHTCAPHDVRGAQSIEPRRCDTSSTTPRHQLMFPRYANTILKQDQALQRPGL